ncbi:MAG: Mrp/NBP35 family ATP-binding protein [Candidatus Thermoplasmatota archaeon]
MEVRTSVIKKRLQDVDHVIGVASGKGGVGKSLIASNLALNLSEEKGFKVGLLDLDLYGPSSHIILGVEDFDFPEEENGILPPKVEDVSFMSVVYFTEDKPGVFRGEDITNIIIELLAITQWHNLDYLIVDMPPGIGEETLDVIRFIPDCEFLVATTPSKVAMGSVEKLLKILKEVDMPVLGVLENMKMDDSTFIQESIQDKDFDYLGGISFDHDLEKHIGKPRELLETSFMKDLNDIADKII